MNIKPIKTKADYKCALAEVGGLMSAGAGTSAGDKLDVLVTLIEAYESRHYPISPPDPIEAIKFCIEQSGLTVKDLEPAIGRSNRVYEVLNGTRSLTLPMIWKLHDMFGIPAESLIRPTARARAA
jgi:HTH-type transcriptional regulator/antitoxin HigA